MILVNHIEIYIREFFLVSRIDSLFSWSQCRSLNMSMQILQIFCVLTSIQIDTYLFNDFAITTFNNGVKLSIELVYVEGRLLSLSYISTQIKIWTNQLLVFSFIFSQLH